MPAGTTSRFQFLIGSLVTKAQARRIFAIAEFQFLIGSLVTLFESYEKAGDFMFQFLIGSLVTGAPSEHYYIYREFQFLIGSLVTWFAWVNFWLFVPLRFNSL